MTLMVTHIDKEFMDGGFEIIVGWIKEDLVGGKSMDQMRKVYDMYTFGSKKKHITEDEFFLAYKSAEIVWKDFIDFQQRKKANQMFRRQ